MRRDEDETYRGKTVFTLSGHKSCYEVTLLSRDGRDWSYSLSFSGESGSESEIEQVEQRLEQDDEWFDALVEAAWSKLEAGV